MKLFSVTFGPDDIVQVTHGLEAVPHDEGLCVDLGTDVSGATLAMVPLRIALDGVTDPRAMVSDEGSMRVVRANVTVTENGKIVFLNPSDTDDDGAFVVLSVIQRSPDKRTEIATYVSGVVCVANAYDKPMDKQVLLLSKGTEVRFRRFERGGNYGSWEVISWNGFDLSPSRADIVQD